MNYKTIDEIQYLTLKLHFKTNKIIFSKEDLNIIIGALKDEGNRININYSFSLIISMFCIFLGTQMGSYFNNVTDVNIYREYLKDFLILIISISYVIIILEYVVKKKISRNRNNQRLIRALENYYINYSA